jgi:uncharacterized protein
MELLIANLISPVVLCFVLGIIAKLIKSDLSVPEPIYQGISIYLLLAIGLKGGASLSTTPLSQLAAPAVMTFILGCLTSVSAFYLIRTVGKLDRTNASAVAAHYGSVSVVTFLAATEAVKRSGMEYEGYLPALVAVLEVPGIIVALLFANQGQTNKGNKGSWKTALHEVITGKSIVLLIGGLAIGALCGPEKLADVNPFFATAFKGALCLFLLELGLIAGKRLGDVRKAGWRLVALGCFIPIFHGLVGVAAATLVGFSSGGAAIFGIMVGSASYIAAPAAVRIALPKANPGYYLTLALGITFPFNLAFGIPILQKAAILFQSIL